MSSVSHALSVEAPRQRAQELLALADPTGRWGPPIWAAEQPVASLQNTPPDALPLKIKLLAFVFSGG